MFCSDARVFSLLMEVPWACHWGTNGMTLSGAVWLVPGVPVWLWYDMRSLGHFVYDLFVGGVWMHPRICFDMIWYDLVWWLAVRALYPFHVWYIGASYSMYTLWIDGYVIMWFETYSSISLGRLVAFLCFLCLFEYLVRRAFVDTCSWFSYDLFMLDISMMLHFIWLMIFVQLFVDLLCIWQMTFSFNRSLCFPFHMLIYISIIHLFCYISVHWAF